MLLKNNILPIDYTIFTSMTHIKILYLFNEKIRKNTMTNQLLKCKRPSNHTLRPKRREDPRNDILN
jgi:hypothetical protein